MRRPWESPAKGTKRPWIKDDSNWSGTDFYKSKEWKDLRKRFLSIHNKCIECGGHANVVDHIVPIRLGGGKLEWNNLQPMCWPCHNGKTISERNKTQKK